MSGSNATHITAIIAWVAGMFYVPRLFGYLCDALKGSPQSKTFKVKEQRGSTRSRSLRN